MSDRPRSGEHRDPGAETTAPHRAMSDRSAFESLVLTSLREIKANLAALTNDSNQRNIRDALLSRDIERFSEKETRWDKTLVDVERLHSHIVSVDGRTVKLEETREAITNALLLRVIGVATFLATVVAVAAAWVMHKGVGP